MQIRSNKLLKCGQFRWLRICVDDAVDLLEHGSFQFGAVDVEDDGCGFHRAPNLHPCEDLRPRNVALPKRDEGPLDTSTVPVHDGVIDKDCLNERGQPVESLQRVLKPEENIYGTETCTELGGPNVGQEVMQFEGCHFLVGFQDQVDVQLFGMTGNYVKQLGGTAQLFGPGDVFGSPVLKGSHCEVRLSGAQLFADVECSENALLQVSVTQGRCHAYPVGPAGVNLPYPN